MPQVEIPMAGQATKQVLSEGAEIVSMINSAIARSSAPDAVARYKEASLQLKRLREDLDRTREAISELESVVSEHSVAVEALKSEGEPEDIDESIEWERKLEDHTDRIARLNRRIAEKKEIEAKQRQSVDQAMTKSALRRRELSDALVRSVMPAPGPLIDPNEIFAAWLLSGRTTFIELLAERYRVPDNLREIGNKQINAHIDAIVCDG